MPIRNAATNWVRDALLYNEEALRNSRMSHRELFMWSRRNGIRGKTAFKRFKSELWNLWGVSYESLADHAERCRRSRLATAESLGLRLGTAIPEDAVLGWKRLFAAHSDLDGTLRLFPQYGIGTYRVGGAMVAACTNTDVEHEAPHSDCRCGIWALKSLADFDKLRVANGNNVIARIAQWGRVFDNGDARRSQYAYPVALYYDYEIVGRRGEMFCPTYPIEQLERLR